MTVSVTIELRPFTVPHYVSQVIPPGKRQDGFREAPKFALHELDDAALNQLCDDFRASVLARAREGREGRDLSR